MILSEIMLFEDLVCYGFVTITKPQLREYLLYTILKGLLVYYLTYSSDKPGQSP